MTIFHKENIILSNLYMNWNIVQNILRWVLLNLLFAELYLAGAELALFISSFNPSAPSAIWPSEGIALAIFILYGKNAFFGLFLGSTISNFLYNTNPFTAIIAGIGNTSGTFINYYITKNFIKNFYPLHSAKSLGYFFTIATYPGAFLASIVGVGVLWVLNTLPSEKFFSIFNSWFVSKELGYVLITPFILSIYKTREQYSWSKKNTLIAIVTIGFTTLFTSFTFTTTDPILILPIPFLIYASFRFRDIGATVSILLVSIVAAYHTIRGEGPFSNFEHSLASITPFIYLDAYIIALTTVSYTLVAVLKERERAQKRAIDNMKEIERMQENARKELELKVIERTKIIQQQKNELEIQISMAQKIQLSLLPQTIPIIPSLEISFQYLPMMKLGGDFLDIKTFGNPPKGITFFICDVSGHGVPAAFLASMVKMSLHHWYENPKDLRKAANEIYRSLVDNIGSNFITASFLHLDLQTKELKFARAGHVPLIIFRKEGKVEEYSPKGKVIMEMSPPDCEEISIPLSPSDLVLLYTDGITEAVGKTNVEMYSTERLIDLIKNNFTKELNTITKEIIDSVIAYLGGIENLEDDLSLLCFRVKDQSIQL